jgi:hypothetical protein
MYSYKESERIQLKRNFTTEDGHDIGKVGCRVLPCINIRIKLNFYVNPVIIMIQTAAMDKSRKSTAEMIQFVKEKNCEDIK